MTILFLLLVWALFFLRELVFVVLTAIVISSAIEPAVKWLGRVRIPRVLGVLLVYALIFLLLFVFFYFFLPPLLHEATGFLADVPRQFEMLGLEAFVNNENLLNPETGALSLRDTLFELRDTLTAASGGLYSAVGSVFGGVFSFILIVILSFYFAVRETSIDDFLRLVTPVKHTPYVLSLWRRSQRKIGRWMQGQILLSLMVGVMVYIGLLLLGIPYALLLAILAAVLELIPVFGSILAAVPAVIIAFINGGTALAVIVVILYFVINQFQGNVVYPLVVQKVVGVPPLLVIIALLAGAQLAGFLGIILSVPIAATLQEFVGDVQREKDIRIQQMNLDLENT